MYCKSREGGYPRRGGVIRGGGGGGAGEKVGVAGHIFESQVYLMTIQLRSLPSHKISRGFKEGKDPDPHNFGLTKTWVG